MRLRATTVLAAAVLLIAPTASWAQVAAYSQDFEGLVQADPAALETDGWLVFGNVFEADGTTLTYQYGAFPAPNNSGSAFGAIDAGQGGGPQGAQQLSVYNDYDNFDHSTAFFLIEANAYREWTVSAADVGSEWLFEFDAKPGNLEGVSTALAFIKTVDPGAGFTLSNFITADMTAIPTGWGTYSLSIPIDASLIGQILQIGFASTATNYEGSGIFYDNVDFGLVASVPGVSPVGIGALALLVTAIGTFAMRRRMAQV